jgi:hypothetical protein
VDIAAFTQTVERWHDFYIMVGTAAATLIGLLFVGLSLNIETIRREAYADLQLLAMQTFNCFFYVLLFAILFLIPRQVPMGLGLPLLSIGGLGLLNMVRQAIRTRKIQRVWGKSTVTQRFTLPVVSLVGMVVISVSVLMGQTAGLYWLVPVMILLLASASQNAWDLLIRIRASERDEAVRQEPPSK